MSEHDSPKGSTPREVARMLRVSADRVRRWIVAGELGAIDTSPARCGRPRYVVLPQHLSEFIASRRAAPAPPTPRPRKKARVTDYYPD
jgi:transposase